ncbi:hypothetical protein PAHAL_5G205300 [Panicum hallii]|uniref:Uncharacterized protein n=1 Tax=Panicum hallii TaxID=206008 RepID=A0A2T8IKT6_9POAL|nr:hypothetical protein PAHAL_5G205300 [Panicum hallii]
MYVPLLVRYQRSSVPPIQAAGLHIQRWREPSEVRLLRTQHKHAVAIASFPSIVRKQRDGCKWYVMARDAVDVASVTHGVVVAGGLQVDRCYGTSQLVNLDMRPRRFHATGSNKLTAARSLGSKRSTDNSGSKKGCTISL